jgi:hypothetical protein
MRGSVFRLPVARRRVGPALEDRESLEQDGRRVPAHDPEHLAQGRGQCIVGQPLALGRGVRVVAALDPAHHGTCGLEQQLARHEVREEVSVHRSHQCAVGEGHALAQEVAVGLEVARQRVEQIARVRLDGGSVLIPGAEDDPRLRHARRRSSTDLLAAHHGDEARACRRLA